MSSEVVLSHDVARHGLRDAIFAIPDILPHQKVFLRTSRGKYSQQASSILKTCSTVNRIVAAMVFIGVLMRMLLTNIAFPFSLIEFSQKFPQRLCTLCVRQTISPPTKQDKLECGNFEAGFY
ncbi:hypothetical protein ABKN59_011285 [Abortiporus biennis]